MAGTKKDVLYLPVLVYLYILRLLSLTGLLKEFFHDISYAYLLHMEIGVFLFPVDEEKMLLFLKSHKMLVHP